MNTPCISRGITRGCAHGLCQTQKTISGETLCSAGVHRSSRCEETLGLKNRNNECYSQYTKSVISPARGSRTTQRRSRHVSTIVVVECPSTSAVAGARCDISIEQAAAQKGHVTAYVRESPAMLLVGRRRNIAE